MTVPRNALDSISVPPDNAPLIKSEPTTHSDVDQIGTDDRLKALQESALLDSPPEEAFNRVVRVLGRTLGVPVGLVSLVTPHRQFFKAQIGLSEPFAAERETPLSHSFCQHVVSLGQPFVVNDARRDPLMSQNPAISDMGVIAYLGVPLRSPEGLVLGALCAIDTEPRVWSRNDLSTLYDLSEMLMTELALRACLRKNEQLEGADSADQAKREVK